MVDLTDVPFPLISAGLPPFDALSISRPWLAEFSSLCSSGDIDGLLGLLHPSVPSWRDHLSLTWDIRTFIGLPNITPFLQARLAENQLRNFKLIEEYTKIYEPFPDTAYVELIFQFETKFGQSRGVVRLVPLHKTAGELQSLDDIEWKAHTVFTNLDSLTGFPEKTGALRNSQRIGGKQWADQRRAATEFLGAEEDEAKGPKVLVIGAGQSGLEVAARLKALGVPTLVIEQNERVGDSWRSRHETLCLHDPVWYDHMPYIPFPPTWPKFCPSEKLANWLEQYADHLELNVWVSSTISTLSQDPKTKKWRVTIIRRQTRLNGQVSEQERTLSVKHIIFCTGMGSQNPPIPSFSGMDTFKGQVLHSSQYKHARDYQGKKVVILGSGTSARDISADCHEQGVDVTIFQRSSTYVMSVDNGSEVIMKAWYSDESPPIDTSDLVFHSFPIYSAMEMSRRLTRCIAKLDHNMLESLRKVGFRTNLGPEGTGLMLLIPGRAGGYYLDTGTSKYIADGGIKLKNDSQISYFAERAIVFDDGSEVEADVVICATGFGNALDRVTSVLSGNYKNAELIKQLKPIWGLDAEGEVNGVWGYRKLGVPGLWYMVGNLATCRFYSKHIALQIKAMEEGMWDGGVYEGSSKPSSHCGIPSRCTSKVEVLGLSPRPILRGMGGKAAVALHGLGSPSRQLFGGLGRIGRQISTTCTLTRLWTAARYISRR